MVEVEDGRSAQFFPELVAIKYGRSVDCPGYFNLRVSHIRYTVAMQSNIPPPPKCSNVCLCTNHRQCRVFQNIEERCGEILVESRRLKMNQICNLPSRKYHKSDLSLSENPEPGFRHSIIGILQPSWKWTMGRHLTRLSLSLVASSKMFGFLG